MTRISNPGLVITNETIAYVPETLKITSMGLGENTVEVVTTGNGNVDIVVGDDITSRKCEISIEVYNRSSDVDLVRRLKNNRENNTIVFENDDTSLVFRKCTMTNDPAIDLTSDGTIELMFQGLPIE